MATKGPGFLGIRRETTEDFDTLGVVYFGKIAIPAVVLLIVWGILLVLSMGGGFVFDAVTLGPTDSGNIAGGAGMLTMFIVWGGSLLGLAVFGIIWGVRYAWRAIRRANGYED